VTLRTLDIVRDELSGSPASRDGGGELGSERAFRRLLRAIVTLEYEPGRIVSERELMIAADATRPALRLAVVRLADLGLITPMARKGLLVAPLDVTDVSTVYDARLAIETAVVRFAAQRATPKQISSLRALAQERFETSAGDEAAAFLTRDLALHLALAAAGRNQYLDDALTRILPLHARLWHRLYHELGTDRKFMFEHDEIIEALAARDADAAASLVVTHLQSAREILASVFLPLTEGFPR
jgi:DNA-binding GntR family transcriptional regulator